MPNDAMLYSSSTATYAVGVSVYIYTHAHIRTLVRIKLLGWIGDSYILFLKGEISCFDRISAIRECHVVIFASIYLID